jgi:SAM-dependent methyltransferase
MGAIRHCRVCAEEALTRLWPDAYDAALTWYRCLACGCDSSEQTFPNIAPRYNLAYIQKQNDDAGGYAKSKASMAAMFDWFDAHRGAVPDNTFLDVGCCNGAALEGMQDRGWAVHGFDIVRPPYYGPHVTVAPYFTAGLFPRQYGAVLASEVLEHVPGWRDMLQQLHAVTAPRGILQLQTPRPTAEPNPAVYQEYHLQIFTPMAIRYWLERQGWWFLDQRIWATGQSWLLQRIN